MNQKSNFLWYCETRPKSATRSHFQEFQGKKQELTFYCLISSFAVIQFCWILWDFYRHFIGVRNAVFSVDLIRTPAVVEFREMSAKIFHDSLKNQTKNFRNIISNTYFINSLFFFLAEWSLVEKQPFQILEIQRTKHITQTGCVNRLPKKI
jgi:hypothetical protein